MGGRRTETKKSLPRFETEDEERRFWARHDVVDYFDWEKAVRGSFPALKPSTTTISVRLPAAMVQELKALANERDVPYQSLLKVYLAERIARERQERRRPSSSRGAARATAARAKVADNPGR